MVYGSSLAMLLSFRLTLHKKENLTTIDTDIDQIHWPWRFYTHPELHLVSFKSKPVKPRKPTMSFRLDIGVTENKRSRKVIEIIQVAAGG